VVESVITIAAGYRSQMSQQKNADNGPAAAGSEEVHADEVEAAVDAGGKIVGTSADDELLVEGPNSE
jgi:hypothetical protein